MDKVRKPNISVYKHIIKQNTNIAEIIQLSEFTQSITIPSECQNIQKYETLLV
jgi:hypothetical protein